MKKFAVILIPAALFFATPAALAQCEVRKDLRGAADHGSVAVHRGVAGHHANPVRPEHSTQIEKLLTDERFDWRCVKRALTEGDGAKVRRECNQ